MRHGALAALARRVHCPRPSPVRPRRPRRPRPVGATCCLNFTSSPAWSGVHTGIRRLLACRLAAPEPLHCAETVNLEGFTRKAVDETEGS